VLDGCDLSGATPATSKISLGAIDTLGLPAWSPDGTRVAYLSSNSQAIFIYSESGTVTLTLPPGLRGVFWPSDANPWLPDGRGLVFESIVGPPMSSHFQLFYIDAVDGAQPVPLSDPGISLFGGFTSRDGGSLVLLSDTGVFDSHGGTSVDVYSADLSTRQLSPAVKINGATGREFFQVDWSPDSQRIVLPIEYGIEPPLVLERADFGVADPKPLNVGSLKQVVDNQDHLAWSADSRHVVIVDAGAHLSELALDGSAPLPLGTDTVLQAWPVSASPRRYDFFANCIFGATLYYTAVDGSTASTPLRLDAADPSTNQLAVSQTLGTVFYAAGSNAVYMIDLSGSTPGQPAQLFPGSTDTTRIALGE
jgi:Tol biopolymer transport system component